MMASKTREEKNQIVAAYRSAARGQKMQVARAAGVSRSSIYRWDAREATLAAVDRIRESFAQDRAITALEEEMDASLLNHPLLQPRQPLPGRSRYVYGWREAEEMIDEVLEQAEGDERREVCRVIEGLVGAKLLRQINMERYAERKKARGRQDQPAAVTATKKHNSHSSWCRHCHGPVADGSGDCGECR